MLELSNANAALRIAPELGASVLSYALSDGQQIFRPRPDATGAFDTACYLLTPWCNRIDRGIALPDDVWHAIDPTHPLHPMPIHGSAAQHVWTVEHATSDHAMLSAVCHWPAPFHYRACAQYRLTGAALQIRLSVQHLGERPLPYGLGLHPWFVRSPSTRLLARATHWQMTDERQIPIADASVEMGSSLDFKTARSLPDDLIDTAFGGWDGAAELELSDDLTVAITTQPALVHYHLYSTGRQADFVCFEPVSHPVNAHNMAGYPGLKILRHGESTSIAVNFSPRTRN